HRVRERDAFGRQHPVRPGGGVRARSAPAISSTRWRFLPRFSSGELVPCLLIHESLFGNRSFESMRAVDSRDRARLDSAHFPAPTGGAMTYAISRRKFLTTTAAGAALLGRAPAALGQQVREIQVWHTEVEPQTVKMIQDTSIAEFEKKFPGFKVKQQALGWRDLNTKLLAALAAAKPPDLPLLNPFITAPRHP